MDLEVPWSLLLAGCDGILGMTSGLVSFSELDMTTRRMRCAPTGVQFSVSPRENTVNTFVKLSTPKRDTTKKTRARNSPRHRDELIDTTPFLPLVGMTEGIHTV